jgi:hypothetical protein
MASATGGPGGLADFIVHHGPAMEALWAILGQARLDADTARLLATKAEYSGGTVGGVGNPSYHAQIRLMQALGELGTGNSSAR